MIRCSVWNQVLDALASWHTRHGLPIRRLSKNSIETSTTGLLFWERDEDYSRVVVQWAAFDRPVCGALDSMRHADTVQVDACDGLWAAMPLTRFLSSSGSFAAVASAAAPTPLPFRDSIPPYAGEHGPPLYLSLPPGHGTPAGAAAQRKRPRPSDAPGSERARARRRTSTAWESLNKAASDAINSEVWASQAGQSGPCAYGDPFSCDAVYGPSAAGRPAPVASHLATQALARAP